MATPDPIATINALSGVPLSDEAARLVPRVAAAGRARSSH